MIDRTTNEFFVTTSKQIFADRPKTVSYLNKMPQPTSVILPHVTE